MSVFRDVVAAHHAESDAILVASREPCISIAYDERRAAKGRSFRVVDPGALGSLALRKSWRLAVLLCPGDDTELVAEWFLSGRRDARRVIFYLHPQTDARKALGAWWDADLPVVATWAVKDWKELHRHFGAAWNVRVFDDFR